ncbi:MAG: pyridoxamine 5'-phosphate oxidase family protein [Flavobacterium sp.]|nr:pyridoxamine 5'-phosphate oxidase family protein [Flavobacterium sp.]
MNGETHSISINSVAYNLQEIEDLAWKKMVNGSVKKKNGFRTMYVATVNQLGEATMRTVVNRKVDQLRKTIYFHTDIRSQKIADLRADNRLFMLFYDAKQRVQIVVKAHAILHTDDDLKNNRWKATSAQARLGYMTLDAPNTESELPTLGYDTKFSENKPTETESDFYKGNFVVIECVVYELSFLYLDYLGNRKANFMYENATLANSHWAVP